ncbi:thiol-disulfide oxidoreductase DCC family protein [Bacillus salacetis]|uniref:Thiol-disulfide oxidoreductase DCC family protein n=1 Tax=Bacillus salacetis TaxID=2315464 RepID=A0A3A1RBV3_9BACI|nr:thiol-disulfide oxidoreductase DCC family protein [Bacillus salacetis]RIW38413.1 thiol-disulfide oxidoreductase DCC family protein [Bacillus salacetis]
MHGIILFDGVCNLCNNIVQFVIKRDKAGYFQFASQQSPQGKALLEEYQIDPETDSFILIEQGRAFMKSTAALRVSKNLDGFWKVFYSCLLIPKPARDVMYDYIARNRYKWFGKKESCMLPGPEMKKRFIE